MHLSCTSVIKYFRADNTCAQFGFNKPATETEASN